MKIWTVWQGFVFFLQLRYPTWEGGEVFSGGIEAEGEIQWWTSTFEVELLVLISKGQASIAYTS